MYFLLLLPVYVCLSSVSVCPQYTESSLSIIVIATQIIETIYIKWIDTFGPE